MTTREGQILDAIGATLATITIANGYHQDVDAASIFRWVDMQPRDFGESQLPVLGFAPAPDERHEIEMLHANRSLDQLRIVVRGIVAGVHGEARQEAVAEFLRDVVRALRADNTCGGYAIDTIPTGWDVDSGASDLRQDGGRGQFVLRLTITFQRDWDAFSD